MEKSAISLYFALSLSHCSSTMCWLSSSMYLLFEARTDLRSVLWRISASKMLMSRYKLVMSFYFTDSSSARNLASSLYFFASSFAISSLSRPELFELLSCSTVFLYDSTLFLRSLFSSSRVFVFWSRFPCDFNSWILI